MTTHEAHCTFFTAGLLSTILNARVIHLYFYIRTPHHKNKQAYVRKEKGGKWEALLFHYVILSYLNTISSHLPFSNYYTFSISKLPLLWGYLETNNHCCCLHLPIFLLLLLPASFVMIMTTLCFIYKSFSRETLFFPSLIIPFLTISVYNNKPD